MLTVIVHVKHLTDLVTGVYCILHVPLVSEVPMQLFCRVQLNREHLFDPVASELFHCIFCVWQYHDWLIFKKPLSNISFCSQTWFDKFYRTGSAECKVIQHVYPPVIVPSPPPFWRVSCPHSFCLPSSCPCYAPAAPRPSPYFPVWVVSSQELLSTGNN